MILFSFLARYNLIKIRSRVRPTGGTSQDIHIHKRDHDLMKMLIGEVIVFSLTTSVYPFNTMYSYLTIPIKAYKSPVRLAVESLIGYIIHPLLSYTYCCTQFYGKLEMNINHILWNISFLVYAFFSQKFREDFTQLFRRGSKVQNSTVTTGHTAGRMEKTVK